MIKDVFNSIAASSGSGSSSSAGQLNGSKEGNTEAGFFGKMLLALQNDGSGEVQSQEKESKDSNNEGDELNTLLMGENKAADESVNVVSNEESEEGAEEELGDQEMMIQAGETEMKDTVRTVPVENVGNSSPEETSNQKEEVLSESTNKLLNANAEGSEVAGEKHQQQVVSEQHTDNSAAVNNEQVRVEGSEHTDSKAGIGVKTDSSNMEKVNVTSTEPIKQDVPNTTSATNEPLQASVATEAVGSNQGKIPNEGNVQATSFVAAGSEQLKQEPEIKGQDPVLKPQQVPKAETNDEGSAGTQSPQKEIRTETESGERKKFFSLNREAKSGPVRLPNEMADKQVKATSQESFTSVVNPKAEQVNRDPSAKVDLKENPQLQVELTNAKQINEERSKRYDLFNQHSEGRTVSGERLASVASTSGGGANQHGMSFSSQPTWMQFQANNQQANEFSVDQQAFFNEQILESTEAADNGSGEQAKLHMNRLAEIPINNVILKRKVLPGLTGMLQKATSAGKEMPQSWQKHSFDLDDGNKIDLSTRNVDGVIQVKIASSSLELSKLMQQYGQEIKEHLEQECELNIDLQFDGGENEAAAGFSDNSSSSENRRGNTHSSESGTSKVLNKKAEEHLQQTVRKFGYNQMEWTI